MLRNHKPEPDRVTNLEKVTGHVCHGNSVCGGTPLGDRWSLTMAHYRSCGDACHGLFAVFRLIRPILASDKPGGQAFCSIMAGFISRFGEIGQIPLIAFHAR